MRTTILMKVSLTLSDLAVKALTDDPKGLLFGESMVKNIRKYLSTFTVLDKAQYICVVFSVVVFLEELAKGDFLLAEDIKNPIFGKEEAAVTKEMQVPTFILREEEFSEVEEIWPNVMDYRNF
ncbi:hypothetical protein NDU88_003394 [Pleurodeles waltl]|uniref:Uncharacterized protein n=1 Tax=Pleurodeles waltl TaxID=8319 RepID=A0AAV7KVE7_PLEWA|nr:hypothetical protein NDU88_003394 [Pleurodeles waltl]